MEISIALRIYIVELSASSFTDVPKFELVVCLFRKCNLTTLLLAQKFNHDCFFFFFFLHQEVCQNNQAVPCLYPDIEQLNKLCFLIFTFHLAVY